MEQIPHRDFRNQSSDLLRRVEAGDSFTISNHGKPVAVVHPISELGNAITARVERPAFDVESFSVRDISADLLSILLANRGTSR